MSDDSREFMAWIDALAKGILAGCAFGYLFSLTGAIPSAKAVVLGGLAGCLASITFKNKRDDKKAERKAEREADKKTDKKANKKSDGK
jgi:flagellar biosynthesis component FlhA